MWLPFVTRVCMRDRGGPKNNMQLTWTSQLNARLFCGDSKGYFSELVDVATVEAGQWQDTQVYALFRNEWGMSAVCVYKLGDIEKVFINSPFKGSDKQEGRSRECVPDSTKILSDTLKKIEKNTDMKDSVQPVDNSGPLLTNHHNYTHIYVDGSQKRSTVLFLSLNNGEIHKVMQNNSQTIVIAEYHPFEHRAHILSMMLNPDTGKLYVNSRNELVQMDVANCNQYGKSVDDCRLSRDPYCIWNCSHCIPNIQGTLQDKTQEDKCLPNVHNPGKEFYTSHHQPLTDTPADETKENIITLCSGSKYFLRCPMLSHHAQYTWQHPKSNTSCSMREKHCDFLIDNMGDEQVGIHKCVSEEMGYRRVLVEVQLKLGNRAAGRSSSPLVWLGLLAVLIHYSEEFIRQFVSPE
ncbi:semaphorin-7A [Centropristis striata]|uniref:semaphorin-7A n=1 Tax=Centropristis striata TaxID=184440 RepID=UPI0027E13397|nr:semaphorin-7A [Centropristis striata]